MKALRELAAEVELSGPLAVWVLLAHLYATLLPLSLCFVVHAQADYLAQVTDFPVLFYVAAALLSAGSAFEVAQNAQDHWYLTPETGSAKGSGFCDFLFHWFITAGQAAIAVAIAGRLLWVDVIAAAAVLALPLCYFTRVAVFAPLAVSGLLVAALALRAFGDPVILLQFVATGLTMYCFAGLLRTGNQALHGFTTAAAASGLLFLLWAMANGAAGTRVGWPVVLGVATVAGILAALTWPLLLRLPATPRAG